MRNSSNSCLAVWTGTMTVEPRSYYSFKLLYWDHFKLSSYSHCRVAHCVWLVAGQIDAAEIQLSLRTIGVNISVDDANRILLRSVISVSLSNIWRKWRKQTTLKSVFESVDLLITSWSFAALSIKYCNIQWVWMVVAQHPDMIHQGFTVSEWKDMWRLLDITQTTCLLNHLLPLF